MSQQIMWHTEELQSPVAARKSSPGNGPARRLDPLPIVRLRCSLNNQPFPPQMTGNFSLSSLFCVVDLFRLPPLGHNDPRPGLTYFWHEGGFDPADNKIFVLLRTEHPNNNLDVEYRIGNHLILGSAVESTLLYGPRVAQAYEHPESHDVIFTFPSLGVSQIGQYIMRYRIYDRRFSQVLVGQCFGSPFSVFNEAGFPGLEPPTPLTQSLAPLNVPGVQTTSRRRRF